MSTPSLLRTLLLLIVAAVLSSMVSAKTVEYNFTLQQVLGTHGDGDAGTGSLSPDCSDIWEERRWLYIINEGDQPPQLPGPTIEANEGDLVRVTVHNKVEVMAATIHWHRMHQRGMVWNDGTSQITQCSLNPFATQTYEFIAYPAGTHYYHSHQDMTVVDGLAGALIVHPKEPEPFEYDEERMVFLKDFFDQTSLQQQAGLMADQLGWVGNPDSLLLNGKGLSKHCVDFNGTQPIEYCLNECNADDKDCIIACAEEFLPACLDTCSDTLAWTPSILVEKGKMVSTIQLNSNHTANHTTEFLTFARFHITFYHSIDSASSMVEA